MYWANQTQTLAIPQFVLSADYIFICVSSRNEIILTNNVLLKHFLVDASQMIPGAYSYILAIISETSCIYNYDYA